MGWQQVIIIGNVGRDPEMRYTPQGVAVCDFSVAVTEVTGRGETRKEKTTWFKVTVWRERAETAAQYVKKGKQIMVVGTIDTSAYTNKQGEAKASLELTASNFQFLGSRDDSDGAAAGRGAANSGSGERESTDIPF